MNCLVLYNSLVTDSAVMAVISLSVCYFSPASWTNRNQLQFAQAKSELCSSTIESQGAQSRNSANFRKGCNWKSTRIVSLPHVCFSLYLCCLHFSFSTNTSLLLRLHDSLYVFSKTSSLQVIDVVTSKTNILSLNIDFDHLCSRVVTWNKTVTGHPAPLPVNLKSRIFVTWPDIVLCLFVFICKSC